jgi:hypothetical protein
VGQILVVVQVLVQGPGGDLGVSLAELGYRQLVRLAPPLVLTGSGSSSPKPIRTYRSLARSLIVTGGPGAVGERHSRGRRAASSRPVRRLRGAPTTVPDAAASSARPSASTRSCAPPPGSACRSTSTRRWHNETGSHFLRLVLSGVFDRYPNLRVFLGH